MAITTKTLYTSFPYTPAGLPSYQVMAPDGTVLVARSSAGLVTLPSGAFAAQASWDDATDAIELWDWSGNYSAPRLWDRRLAFLPSIASILVLIQGSGGTVPPGISPINDPQSASANVSWSQRFTALGMDSAGWTRLTFTIKANKDSDLDSAALAIVRVSNPADPATDGLLLWKGQTAPPAMRGSAALAVTLAGVDTILDVSLGADVMALKPSDTSAPYAYEINRWIGTKKDQMGIGDYNLARNVLRGIAAP